MEVFFTNPCFFTRELQAAFHPFNPLKVIQIKWKITFYWNYLETNTRWLLQFYFLSSGSLRIKNEATTVVPKILLSIILNLSKLSRIFQMSFSPAQYDLSKQLALMENLQMGAPRKPDAWTVSAIYF